MLEYDDEYNELVMPEYYNGMADPDELDEEFDEIEEDVYEDIYYNDKYDYGDYI